MVDAPKARAITSKSIFSFAVCCSGMLLSSNAVAQQQPQSPQPSQTTQSTQTTPTPQDQPPRETTSENRATTDPLAGLRSTQTPPANQRAQQRDGIVLRFSFPGEWQLRLPALSTIGLATTPGETNPNTLGQNWYFEQWFRFRPSFQIGESLRFIAQFDIARGILFGQSTQMVDYSRDARSTRLSPFSNGIFDLRALFVDWNTPIGIIRAGHQLSHWGLGIVANDGTRPGVFGDYRLGDIVERIAFVTRPFGRNSDLVVALAADLVFRDRTSSLVDYQVPVEGVDGTRTLGNDRVWQGVLSIFYQSHTCNQYTEDCGKKRIGGYMVYRDHTNRFGDFLRVVVVDLAARWEWPTPDRAANVFLAAEVAGIFGATTITRTPFFPQQSVFQFGGAMELGVERPGAYRATLLAGYASGDPNPVDETQTRFTFNPSYRVGLLMFNEVLAWQTARSASIAADPRLLGRPTPGAELLPTSGGVANAMYVNPTVIVNLGQRFDVRGGVLVGVATSDLVDPIQVQAYGSARNFQGGNARARDLGVEIDLGFNANVPLGGGVGLVGGLHGAILFPGHAFDGPGGRPLNLCNASDPNSGACPLGLIQTRLGLTF